MIFTDEGKALFTKAFEEAVPDWIFNTGHALDVSKWIALGYLERKGLSEKIKELDGEHFEIITKNAKDIIGIGIPSEKKAEFEQEDEKRIVQQLYHNIVSTRNYYSHYKEDTRGVLNFTQMCHTINVLKALIIINPILFNTTDSCYNTPVVKHPNFYYVFTTIDGIILHFRRIFNYD